MANFESIIQKLDITQDLETQMKVDFNLDTDAVLQEGLNFVEGSSVQGFFNL